MKSAIWIAAALCIGAGPAFADATIVAPLPGAPVIEHRSDSDADSGKKVVIKKDGDCMSKTVKKTDDVGNSVSRTKTNC